MEEKKRRKRPNFFDVLFLALILVLAVGAYLVSHGMTSRQQTVTRTYLLEVAGLEPGMEQSIHVGDTVTDNIRNYEIGVITEVKEVPSLDTIFDQTTQVVRQTPVPDSVTLQLTIQAETTEDEKNVTTTSGYVLKTGKAVSCTAGPVTCSGYILHVDR